MDAAMARPQTLSDDDLVSRLAGIFRQKGYEGASLSELAAASGLGKAALYHRFPEGKEAMATAVLSATERRMGNDVLAPLAQGDAAERLAAMAGALFRFYEGGMRSCLVDLFSVAGTPDGVRGKVCRGTAEWIATIAAALVEAGFAPEEARRRGEDAVIRIEGALVVSRALGDQAPFRRVLERLAGDLLAPIN